MGYQKQNEERRKDLMVIKSGLISSKIIKSDGDYIKYLEKKIELLESTAYLYNKKKCLKNL